MADFNLSYSQLGLNEGGYSNNPADPGGETMYGVTERVARKHGYQGPMKDLPIELARQIAKQEYWDPYHCDELSDAVAFSVFDTAYNGGHPGIWLQQAAGMPDNELDGVIGPHTVSIVNSRDQDKVVLRFDAYRIRYLDQLPTWPSFGKGWMNRIANNMIWASNH